jgi:hypothetical protein
MTRREIRTNEAQVECEVCGRSLLRGEHPETYITGGRRVPVCELCTGRAEREGWIKESEGAQLGARARGPERRSILKRLRARREQRMPPPEPAAASEAGVPPPAAPDEHLYAPEPRAERERHVHAVPTSDELKISRALELFNASEHPRTVAGVARSLGAPLVAVRPTDGSSIVTLTVAWELCWYRYEVDLAHESGGVRVDDQGYELSELEPDEQVANAAADEGGGLQLAAA